MIYLDSGATSLVKPAAVYKAVSQAMQTCGNPGRGGHRAAMAATQTVYNCRETAAELFDCQPEQVVFTSNCTHGLNIAINSLVKPGSRVVVSGFEHNAVTRPLHSLQARLQVAGRKLFDPEDTLWAFQRELDRGVDAAVFTHVSNVFGYILPIQTMAAMCRQRGIPFIIDAAQSAGSIPISLNALGADFIAMPGHKGLLGPQGTGILLCSRIPEPLMAGGTGSESIRQSMPDDLPERAEAGTLNVPGIAGLNAGLRYLKDVGVERLGGKEQVAAQECADMLRRLGFQVYSGPNQGGVVSFVPRCDGEEAAEKLAGQGIALRAGLHCAPLAHESAGTLETGTVRVSFGIDACPQQIQALRRAILVCGIQ